MVITRRSQIPGARFKPKKLELVNHYLRRRIEKGKSCCFIPEIDLYEKEPWLLQHVRDFRSYKNVWFYFVTRKKLAGIKKEDSKKIHRRAGRGRWKTNGFLIDVKDNNGVKVGSKQLITFNYKTNIEAGRDKATGWVMHEYVLDKPEFQKLVLCKIKFKLGMDHAQYAPRFESIVIGQPKSQPQTQPQPPLGEDRYVAEEIQYSNVPLEAPQVIEQHQEFGYCGQLVGAHQQNNTSGRMMAQAIEEQQRNVHSGPYSAQPYDTSQVPQAMEEQQRNVQSGPYLAQPYDTSQVHQVMEEHQWNVDSGPYLAQPYDTYQVPQAMEEQQWNMHSGPYSAQLYDPLQLSMERQQLWDAQYQQWLVEQQQSQIIEQANHLFQELPMMMNQATEQQQRSEYSGPYSAQPHDQNRYIEENEDWSYLMNFKGLAEDTDPSQFPMELHEQYESFTEKNEEDWNDLINLIDFEEDIDLSEFPMELQEQYILQQEHQIIGQDTQPSSHLPYMMNLDEQQYAHPYHQCFGQKYDLSMFPTETQNQDNVIGNSTEEQEQPYEQATDLPINQGNDEPHGGIAGSSTHNNLFEKKLL